MSSIKIFSGSKERTVFKTSFLFIVRIKINRFTFYDIFALSETAKAAIFEITRRGNHNRNAAPVGIVTDGAIAEHPMGSCIYTDRNVVFRRHPAIGKIALSPRAKGHTGFTSLAAEHAGLKNRMRNNAFVKIAFVIALNIHAIFEDAVLENRNALQNFDPFLKDLIYVFLLKHIYRTSPP